MSQGKEPKVVAFVKGEADIARLPITQFIHGLCKLKTSRVRHKTDVRASATDATVRNQHVAKTSMMAERSAVSSCILCDGQHPFCRCVAF